MKNYFYALLAATILLAIACTKNFESTNSNPNAPEQVPSTYLLLSGLSSGIFGVVTDRYGTFQSGINTIEDPGHWVQYYSGIQFPDRDQYIVDPTGFFYFWGTYFSALKDVDAIIKNPKNGDNMIGAAMVVRAFLYSQMVDMYGDIPYSQALQIESITQPKYDTQEFIYKDLTLQLSLAAAKFETGNDALGVGDILYNGDILKWKKFANSLRARLLNHYKHLDPEARKELVQLLTDPIKFPVFENNEDNAQLIPTNVFPYKNTMFLANNAGSLTGNDGVSEVLVNLLKTLNDPRLPVYAQVNNNGEYLGKPSGAKGAANLGDYSNLGKVFRDDPYFPASAITYPELLFIKAEALNDKQVYLEGIKAAMGLYGITADANYLNSVSTAYDANQVEAIIIQKWLALFGRNSIEAFTEFRRTGFPNFIHEALNSTYKGLGVPYRFHYPNNEEATNRLNLDEARSRQHINQAEFLYGDKMWWAKK